jgi:hypothetical protein
MTRLFFRTGFTTALFVGSAILGDPAEASLRSFKGQAYEPETSAMLYSEKFDVKLEGAGPVSLKTEYRNPAGALIAERTLDFSRHPFKPEYRLIDLRDGYEEGARVLEAESGKTKKNTSRVRVYVRENRDKEPREKILEVPEPCVIDGGFNVFIKAHWDELAAGKRVPFNFVASARRDWFAFEAVPAGFDEASAEESTPAGGATRTFVVRPQNGALRLLVVPIRVTYDVATRRITEYRGISNVNKSRGKSFKVRILYPALGP